MKYLVWGAGVSGIGACLLLSKLGQKVCLYDEDKKKLMSINSAKIVNNNVEFVFGGLRNILHSIDCIVLSPSVILSKNTKKFIKKYYIKVLSEVELGAMHYDGKLIGVTGTNGKTTTTMLCNHVLNYAQKSSDAVGNIGNSICYALSQNVSYEYLVCELSSFQLWHSDNLRVNIGVFLNFAPDHLDKHTSLEEYLDAKRNIFKNQTLDDFALLNYDDAIVRVCGEDIQSKCLYFSVEHILCNMEYSAWLVDNVVNIKLKDKFHCVTLDNHFLNLGINKYNAMVACVVSILCGVDSNVVSKALSTFISPHHRCEVIYERDGVRYVDDSKATNIHAAKNALGTIAGPIILLLGGSDKGESFDEFLSSLPSNVRYVVCFGQMGKKIYNIVKRYKPSIYKKNFVDAVNDSKNIASRGDTVLLSPACASFDEFSGYEERGDCFKYIVTGENFDKKH